MWLAGCLVLFEDLFWNAFTVFTIAAAWIGTINRFTFLIDRPFLQLDYTSAQLKHLGFYALVFLVLNGVAFHHPMDVALANEFVVEFVFFCK